MSNARAPVESEGSAFLGLSEALDLKRWPVRQDDVATCAACEKGTFEPGGLKNRDPSSACRDGREKRHEE